MARIKVSLMTNHFAFELWTDGSCRQKRNRKSGPAGAGLVLGDGRGIEITTESIYLGRYGSEEAEYLALIAGLNAALKVAKSRPATITVHMDCRNIVQRLRLGNWSGRQDIEVLHRQALALLALFASFELRWHGRDANVSADRAANAALGRRGIGRNIDRLLRNWRAARPGEHGWRRKELARATAAFAAAA